MNTTVANVQLFVFDSNQQTQSLYGYGQDGVSIVRSDDRGLTWSVTDLIEYTNVRKELFDSIICNKKKTLFFSLEDDCTVYSKFESLSNE